jgi:hypothetical protein
MKSVIAMNLTAGLVGGFLAYAVSLQILQPTPPTTDLTVITREVQQLRQQVAETQATLRAAATAEEVARQSERDEVQDAIRLRNKMMGIQP